MTLTREQVEDWRSFYPEHSESGEFYELCDLALIGLAVQPRPIEDAPRDGTEIIAFADDPMVDGRQYSGVAIWANAHTAFPRSVEGWFWPFAIRPTHFIPVSAIPKPKVES